MSGNCKVLGLFDILIPCTLWPHSMTSLRALVLMTGTGSWYWCLDVQCLRVSLLSGACILLSTCGVSLRGIIPVQPYEPLDGHVYVVKTEEGRCSYHTLRGRVVIIMYL